MASYFGKPKPNHGMDIHLEKVDANNPHGLGDPNDRSLRKVELDIKIPQKMRDRAREEKCVPEVEAFNNCCKDSGMSMIFWCRGQNKVMKGCLERWYNDQEFKQQCTEEYLKERSEYRRTGISKKSGKKIQSVH